MASRMDKYSDETFEERTTRNKNLYNTIYGQRSRFEDLPIPDNTNEIDIESFKNITLSRNEYQKKAENKNIEPISKEEEESILERTGSYDINEMLKKAKDSNTFISEKKNNNSNRKYLKVLDIDKNLTKEDVDKEEYLSHNTTLSLDILSDLKPTNNTLVTDPIKDDSLEETKSLLKEMTAKMETIKTITPKEENKENPKDFYSGTYKFSKEDFDNDFASDLVPNRGNTFFKTFLVILTILVITGVTLYILDYLEIISILPK